MAGRAVGQIYLLRQQVVSEHCAPRLADTPKHIEVIGRGYSGFDSEYQIFQ